MSKEQFEVLLADTRESHRLHYVVRYRVFCVETQYEDASRFPDKMERDQFDRNAVHFLVRSRDTGQWVAAMRLVVGYLPDLPLAERCVFDSDINNYAGLQVAEVSRLCVVGTLRRRKQEDRFPHIVPWDHEEQTRGQTGGVFRLERRQEPEILLRLIRAAAAYGHAHQMRYYYALMAQPLMRILRRIGIRIVRVGSACEHRGTRWPCLIDLDKLFLDTSEQDERLREIFQKGPAYSRYSQWRQTTVSDQPEYPAYEETMQR